MKYISQGGTKDVENQVINVTESQQRKHLGQFHSGDDGGGGQKDPPELIQGREDPGEKKSQGNEHDHIV